MKYLFTILLCIILYTAEAQTQRSIRFINYPGDSTNLAYNTDYNLIEDSCAQIKRYAHLHMQTRKFFGKFKDVSIANPSLVVAEGSYTEDGMKNGEYVSYYLNGNLQSKGTFKNDEYDGHWEKYYEDGKPELFFTVTDGEETITDWWDDKGKKIVDKGNGKYASSVNRWAGKLLNGRPDGKWIILNEASGEPIKTEYYKQGKFIKGEMFAAKYDAPTLNMVSLDLPFTNAEKFMISRYACNDPLAKTDKRIMGARFKDGFEAFSEYIKTAVTPYLSTVDITTFNDALNISATIYEDGSIRGLSAAGAFNSNLARGVINALRGLPAFIPATVDGKPVKQAFSIVFTFEKGFYRFTYQTLPIKE